MLRTSPTFPWMYPNPSSSFYSRDLANALETTEKISTYTDIKKLENAFVVYDHTKYNINMYWSAILDSPAADANLIHKIIQKTIDIAWSNAPQIFASAIDNLNTSDGTLRLILDNRWSSSVIESIAKHPTTSFETLQKMYTIAMFDCPHYIPIITSHTNRKSEN